MAKVDYVKINNTIKYIQNIAYLSELPTANEDSADFVSINNVLYAKQVNNGVYSYAEIGGGGTTVIEKQLNEEGTDFIDTFSEEDIDKLIGGALLKVKVNEVASYYLTPMITQQTDEGVKGVGLGGFLDAESGTMLMVNVMTMNGQVRTEVRTTEGFGGEGVEIITADMSWMTSATTGVIPSQYRDIERLKKAIVIVNNGDGTDIAFRYVAEDTNYYYSMGADFAPNQYLEIPLIKINKQDWTFISEQVNSIDYDYLKDEIKFYSGTGINFNNTFPSTATNGTLESSVLQTLQASNENYIVFNNEIFKLADKQHNEGYLVYSHNGHDTTGCFFQKCITITLSTRGWVLEEQENQAKLTAGSGITIENNVISSTGGGGGSNIQVVENDDNTVDLIIS